MKTLKEHIESLRQSDWDYYQGFPRKEFIIPFLTDGNHSNFIRQFFKHAGKQQTINLIDIQDSEISKANHINSIFFLGILIANKLEYEKKYFDETINEKYRAFPFLWFLTSLGHDFGVKYEKDKKILTSILDIETLKNEFNIKKCLLKQRVSYINKTLFSHVRQYFMYRRFKSNRIDHGILAGLYFYDKLIKNRRRKKWNKCLDKYYALVSATIATHNIWIPNDKTACAYIKFGMKSLVNFKPITSKKSPLLYLLSIVDTIDPIKLYTNAFNDNDNDILENLLFDFKNDKIIIQNKHNSKLDFSKLLKKADGFEGWLDVEVEKDENSLIIVLK